MSNVFIEIDHVVILLCLIFIIFIFSLLYSYNISHYLVKVC